MTTAKLRKKIKDLVDHETNEHRLMNALASLSDEVPSPEVQKELNERVARSEADFRAGRWVTGEEAYERIKATLKDRKGDRAA